MIKWLRWKLEIQLLSLHGTSFTPNVSETNLTIMPVHEEVDLICQTHCVGFQTARHAAFYGGGFSWRGQSPERFLVFSGKPVIWGHCGF